MTKKSIKEIKKILENQMKNSEEIAQQYENEKEHDLAMQANGEAAGIRFALELLKNL